MKYFKLFFLLFSSLAFSQDYKSLWSETVQDELDGKTESAYKKVQNIYALAKKENNEEQIIKCFFYISKFRQIFDEKSQSNIINQLREEIANAKPSSKAILNYIYGKILSDFLNYHYYKIKNITTIQGNSSTEITNWSIQDFNNEINKSFNDVFIDIELLDKTPITNFKEILEIPSFVDGKNYSLYELLHNEITKEFIKLVSDYNFRNNLPNTETQINKLYSKTPDFVKIKDDSLSQMFQSFLQIQQQKEIFISKTNPNQSDNIYYKRLLIIDNFFNKSNNLNLALEELEKITTDKNLHFELRLRKIKKTISASNRETDSNDLKEALNKLEEIIKINPNEYITTEAQVEKENILNKILFIKLNEVNYEGENTRAFIDFKNIGILKICYYKISTLQYLNFKHNGDSTEKAILNFTNNKVPYKEIIQSLPDRNDYKRHSTEILMEKLPLGYYIITFEDTNKDSNILLDKNYSFYQVTNIAYVEDENKENDLFYVLDRKTGKPLSNAYFSNKERTIKADEKGKIIHPKKNKEKNNQFIYSYLITEKDTLALNYYPSIKNDYSYNEQDEDRFESKATIYLDRAIYRPGQKVYFKGLLIQNKKNKKSVVPFVTVHLNIEDASYETIKEFDLQTNEFGSFSGEFELPKDCLTGEFSIEIEEPDDKLYSKDKKYYNKKEDEHTFWDNTNFDDKTFYFKVEEYKRPTFEITIDKIKEVYCIGDSVTLKGYAKNLAGSNLTNAIVKYSISRNYNTENYKSFNDENYLIKETTTDSEGSFTIPISFTTKNDSLRDMSIRINIDVTDTNGETRTLNHSIVAHKESLKIKANTVNNFFEEDTNYISVDITNLDEHSIPYQGKIEIYKKEKENYLKRRTFQAPEIQTISEEEFKKLFPFEPYNDSNENNSTLVNTITFDTKKSNKINLPKLEKGFYKTTTLIVDTKGNSISENNHFEIKSKNNPSLDGKLFSYKRINHEDQKQIHFELSSNIPELHITTRFYCGKNCLEEKITKINNGKGIVSFDKLKTPQYDYNFFFSTQFENFGFSENVSLTKESFTQKINFEVISFRNKIEPGSKENWSFKIPDNKLETEVLASMYDTSLDAFAKENWEKPFFYSYASVEYPNIYKNNTNEIYFSTRTKKVYYQKLKFSPRFEWFGFSLTNSKNSYIQKQYEQNQAQTQIIRSGTKTITGIVSDSAGPLPGVNVVIKGTTIGVQTNFDGSYTIHAKEGEILTYSFMGMNEVLKTVGSSNIINTVLKDDGQQLKEVVVTAVGIKREQGTNNPNVIIVSDKDTNLDEFNYYRGNIIKSLEGKVSGLQITNPKELNQLSKRVVLRANSSISSNNNALVIIDGEIKENLDIKDIAADDINSITILKGKEGEALYGSQGKNGVIIITTKNALKELSKVKTRINFNETAFFYPHLTTDRKGKIAFNFTTPESLTKWKLRLLGHDKNANIGNFETEIISQKDLMVMPNMPRFLRETDTITLSAKVVNLTSEVRSGNAILQLFDAVTGNAIDINCLNTANIKTFNCKAKESAAINWTITIPEGIQGIQYKVIAKSGNFSDGEENIIPVLSNKILVTEALPIWIRENSKKELVFESLKNTTSKTLKNQSFTFEYTSNPTWLAIQSLPYLMEFEHECAEQTFARFYANTIASKIIESQPKIAEVFEKWRKEPNKRSKIEMNDELKSIILRETPWFFEADETEKNKRLASLFELEKIKESNEGALKKLKEKQRESGGFAWFDGGQENYYVTQHILSGIGHLNKIYPQKDLTSIIDKAIPFVDSKFITNTQQQRKEKRKITDTELQYLYCRSFYNKTNPITNDTLKKSIQYQIQQSKTNWLQLGLGQKAMLALSTKRFGDSLYAQKIVTHLKETAIKNNEKGMYWLENKSGYYWFDSPIENQALLIEAFAELENNPTIINDLKAWLINQKQRENWGTTKATTEAVYALLSNGTNLTEAKIENNYNIGNKELLEQKMASAITETASGYFKLQWKPEEVNKELAKINIENKSSLPNYGGVYWQYFENLENIKTNNNSSLYIKKEVYKKIKDEKGDKLIPLKESAINIGDKITIRLVINANANLEFVHLKDLRASCLESIDVISKHKESNGLWYYMSTKDTATHFFLDEIKQGTYILEYDARVNNSGVFNNGIATLQSMYAPEFTSHSTSQKINVTVK